MSLRLCLAALLLAGTTPVAAGTAFTYQGELKQSGQRAAGAFDFAFCLYDTADPAVLAPLACAPVQEDVAVSDGRFSVLLDFGPLFTDAARFLEVRVRAGASSGAFTPLDPRQAITPAPQAQHATNAPWSGLSGIPADFADGSDAIGSGTVTSVAAGFGLSGGPITNSGSLAVDPGTIQRRIGDACAPGSYLRAIGEDGSATCETDANAGGTVTRIDSGTGLQGGPIVATGTLAVDFAAVQARIVAGCMAGQALRAVNADGSVVCDTLPAGAVALSAIEDTANEFGYGIRVTAFSGSTPGIAHYDATADALRFVRCNDNFCSGGNEPVNVVVNGNIAEFVLRAAAGGAPLLAYGTLDTHDLKLMRCNDGLCAGGNETTNVVSGSGRPGASVATFDFRLGSTGLPLFAFTDATSSALSFARCNDTLCNGGDESLTTIDDGSSGLIGGVSLGVGIDSNPVLSYCKRNPNDGTSALWLTKCNDAACNGNDETTTLLDNRANRACDYTALAVPSDGFPVIAHEGSSQNGLFVVKCNDTACSGADESRVVADGPLGTGLANGLDMLLGQDGLPLITVRGDARVSGVSPRSTLRFVRCGNPNCSLGNDVGVLDANANLKGPSRLLLAHDGFPLVFYSTFDSHAVRVARCANNSCR